MSKALPTITVTDEQAEKVFEAFKHKYSATTEEEIVTAYKKELTRWLNDNVIASESKKIDEENYVAKQSSIAEVVALLPDPNNVT